MIEKITLDNFDKFIDGSWDYDMEKECHVGLYLHQPNADIGGGQISIEDIDVLKKYPQVDTFTISGLNQETFEYFINTYGEQIRAIRFFKNKKVEDWSLLGNLTKLEFVYFFFNQRITSLWDMSKNESLKGLRISDFSRLKSISGIETAPNLKWFEIGNAVWDKCVIDSIKYFAGTGIEYIKFDGKTIEDKDMSCLGKMKNLKNLIFLQICLIRNK